MKRLIRIKSPIFVNLEITNNCNQHCNFCFSESKQNKKFTPFNKIKKIIDKCADSDVFEIILFGGEPFLHPEIVDVAKYCKDLDFYVGFVSNGTLLNEKMLNNIHEYIDGGSVSIHGFPETHDSIVNKKGSYQKAIKSIEIMTELGIDTGVLFTLIKQNKNQMYKFGKYVLENFEIRYFGVNRFIPQGRGKEMRRDLELSPEEFNQSVKELKRLRDSYRRKALIEVTDSYPFCLLEEGYEDMISPCSSGVMSCAINERGDVKICSACKYPVGNIFDISLEEIWQTSDVLERYRSLEWIPERCKECKKLDQCLAGCRAGENSYFGIDPLLRQ